ncbi:hypothetical protein MLD38_002468 [Melastoma candidum]|uniref:Uncharacterized protein n=1 Tax=Melastoma candidum TaxID=119954 RepID=A0ACB9RZN9_9MYRT|nr:hypothetical protein MLD38_002468 [Melastoma candidum]
MDNAAVADDRIPELCHRLISFAFQRCLISEELCKIFVRLSRCQHSDLAGVRVSVSDTAVASTLEEFQLLRFKGEDTSSEKWDGILSVMTTGNSDEEFHIYDLNLKDSTPTSWLTRLPSVAKDGVKFSGTEVCFTVLENLDLLVIESKQFFQKMLILNMPNITFELAIQEENSHEPIYKEIFLPNMWQPIPFPATNVEKLKHGLALYVMEKRSQPMNNYAVDLSARPNFKFGIGSICKPENYRRKTSAIIMEAVVVMNDPPEVEGPRLRESNCLTKVFYFKDFSPMPLPTRCQAALRSINWKSYGLTLENIVDQGDCTALKWGNLSLDSKSKSSLWHRYIFLDNGKPIFPPKKRKDPCYKKLLKEAAKLALDDLKEKHAGSLLSENAVKVCSHAPDLARTLAGLIMSSNDITFQGECLSLLGFDYDGIVSKSVEERIEHKLISVMELHDRKPKSQKAAAPFLFKDNNDACCHVLSLEEDYVEGSDRTSVITEL